MSKIAVFFAEGFEEIEALTVVDMCRRAEIEVCMVSVANDKSVCGSHGIRVDMDLPLQKVDFADLDMLVLPGGMPGTKNLEACDALMQQVDSFFENGKFVAAICAAPSIFGHRGIVNGKRACCYPGFESHMTGAQTSENPVEKDGNVITSRGMGTAIPFALAIIGELCGEEKADSLAKGIVYR
ncbi:MAG: DJ-1/PfpI family protein [Acetatifactor sp.]|nr:DJ-1/PfpI family protein [Acetatifactor sp.]